MTTTLNDVKTNIDDTSQEVIDCYGGEKWDKEINELFPLSQKGCINFGYWEHIPDLIPLNFREKTQLDLYHKLFEFSNIDRKSISSALEVGCGRGHGVNILNQQGYECHGIDLVESQIQRCIKNYPYIRSNFKQASSCASLFQPNSFNLVYSVEAAQHFQDFFSFVQEAYRVLKNDGKIAITTFFFQDNSSREKIKNIIPEDISGFHRAIEIYKAQEFLKKAGFKNITIESIGAKVFAGFCKWATQSMSVKNHTPRWQEAYEKHLLDYYMIKADKPSSE